MYGCIYPLVRIIGEEAELNPKWLSPETNSAIDQRLMSLLDKRLIKYVMEEDQF